MADRPGRVEVPVWASVEGGGVAPSRLRLLLGLQVGLAALRRDLEQAVDATDQLREVNWWRGSFGAEAADDLQEQVERTARVSTLR